METCIFCQGTLKARFVDMTKVPVGTKFKMGDAYWDKYEQEEDCHHCNGMGFTYFPSNLRHKARAIKLMSN